MDRSPKRIYRSVNFARSVCYCLERAGSGYRVRLANSKADGPAYTAASWPEVGGGSRWESYACAMCVCIGGERISWLTTFLGLCAELTAWGVRKLLGWFYALNFRNHNRYLNWNHTWVLELNLACHLIGCQTRNSRQLQKSTFSCPWTSYRETVQSHCHMLFQFPSFHYIPGFRLEECLSTYQMMKTKCYRK